MIKGFVIVKEGDETSNQLAEECIASGADHGFNIEKFSGVYDNIDQLFETNKLFVNPDGNKKVRTNGVKGCFLSHFSLWKKCVELNETIAVFEYDALVINTLPKNIVKKFDDYLNLDYARHLYLNEDVEKYKSELISSDEILTYKFSENIDSDKRSFKYINRNHIRGAYGYLITPNGASKLINAARTEGMLPADVLPNMKYINLHYTTPSVVRLNPKMLENLTTWSHTKR